MNYLSAELIEDKNIKKQNTQTNFLNVDYFNESKDKFYIVGPGDNLKIDIGRDYPELLTTATIDGEGTILLPLINRIYVEGLSLDELNKLLNEAYLKFTKYPSVQSEIISYRPIKILVDGEVINAGYHIIPGSSRFENSANIGGNFDNQIKNNFDFDGGINLNSYLPQLRNNNQVSYAYPTIYDAIRKSGGITDLSDLSNIEVIRKNKISNGGGKIMTYLNFEDFIIKGDKSQNIRIYDNDIIKIKKLSSPRLTNVNNAIKSNLNPRFINIFIAGRVRNPGRITLGKLSSLNDAIDMAGGTRFIRGPVRYLSYNSDGSLEKRKIAYKKNKKPGSYHNPNLKEGDLIIIGQSFLSNTTEAISEITAPFQGILSTYMLYEAFTD